MTYISGGLETCTAMHMAFIHRPDQGGRITARLVLNKNVMSTANNCSVRDVISTPQSTLVY